MTWDLGLLIRLSKILLVLADTRGAEEGEGDPAGHIPRVPPLALPRSVTDRLHTPHGSSEGRGWGWGPRQRAPSPDNRAPRSHGQGRPVPCPSAVPGMTLMTKTFFLELQLPITFLSATHSINLTDSLFCLLTSWCPEVGCGEVDQRPVLFSAPEPLSPCSWGLAHRPQSEVLPWDWEVTRCQELAQIQAHEGVEGLRSGQARASEEDW